MKYVSFNVLGVKPSHGGCQSDEWKLYAKLIQHIRLIPSFTSLHYFLDASTKNMYGLQVVLSPLNIHIWVLTLTVSQPIHLGHTHVEVWSENKVRDMVISGPCRRTSTLLTLFVYIWYPWSYWHNMKVDETLKGREPLHTSLAYPCTNFIKRLVFAFLDITEVIRWEYRLLRIHARGFIGLDTHLALRFFRLSHSGCSKSSP